MKIIKLHPGDPLPDPLVDCEVYAPEIVRRSAQTGSAPTDIVSISADFGRETRHVITHDVHGVSWWAGQPASPLSGRLYDVTICNVGWQGPDRGHGHALYTQNYATAEPKIIDTCVFMAGFGYNLHLYGSNMEIASAGEWSQGFASRWNKLAGYRFMRSIFTNGTALVGGQYIGAHDVTFDDCVFGARLQLGYKGGNGDGSVTNSLLTSGLATVRGVTIGAPLDDAGKLLSWRKLTVRDNVFILPTGVTVEVSLLGSAWEWDGNTYYSEDEKPFVLRTQNPEWSLPVGGPVPIDDTRGLFIEQRLSFAEWQALTGFDTNSTFVQGPPPQVQRTFAMPELDEQIVFSWGSEDVPAEAQTLYPPPDPIGWDGPAPAVAAMKQPIRVWRETTAQEPAPDCSECEAALATALADAGAMREEIEGLTARNALLTKDLDAALATVEAERETVIRLQNELADAQKTIHAARNLWAASKAFGELMEAT